MVGAGYFVYKVNKTDSDGNPRIGLTEWIAISRKGHNKTAFLSPRPVQDRFFQQMMLFLGTFRLDTAKAAEGFAGSQQHQSRVL